MRYAYPDDTIQLHRMSKRDASHCFAHGFLRTGPFVDLIRGVLKLLITLCENTMPDKSLRVITIVQVASLTGPSASIFSNDTDIAGSVTGTSAGVGRPAATIR